MTIAFVTRTLNVCLSLNINSRTLTRASIQKDWRLETLRFAQPICYHISASQSHQTRCESHLLMMSCCMCKHIHITVGGVMEINLTSSEAFSLWIHSCFFFFLSSPCSTLALGHYSCTDEHCQVWPEKLHMTDALCCVWEDAKREGSYVKWNIQDDDESSEDGSSSSKTLESTPI